MKTKANIRCATLTDLDVIEILQRMLFEFDNDYDGTINLECLRSSEAELIRKERISGKGLLLVAEVDGQPVGYLMAAEVFSDSSRLSLNIAEAEEFFILHAWRNKWQMASYNMSWQIECKKLHTDHS